MVKNGASEDRFASSWGIGEGVHVIGLTKQDGNGTGPRYMRLNSFWEYLGHYSIGVALLPVPIWVAFEQFYEHQTNVWKADPFMITMFGGGVLFCVQQWRALRCDKVSTHNTAPVNYRKVSKFFRRMKWQIRRKQDGKFIQAVSSWSGCSNGEAVTTFFEGNIVYVNSIYDPQSKNGGGRGKKNKKNMAAIERIVVRQH